MGQGTMHYKPFHSNKTAMDIPRFRHYTTYGCLETKYIALCIIKPSPRSHRATGRKLRTHKDVVQEKIEDTGIGTRILFVIEISSVKSFCDNVS
jgi:hypothetical protein